MKSTFAKFVLPLILAGGMNVVVAGAQPAIPAVSSSPSTQVALGNDTADSGAGNNGARPAAPYKPENRVRCWQEGRMIFEASGVNVERAATVSSLETLKAGTGTIQLFDFKHGLCIMEKIR